MVKPESIGTHTREAFEFISMDKKITEKEIEDFLKDSKQKLNI